ncbi:MAG: DNA polymerase (family X) [Candidatus Peregrinibacteria bacterium Greene1014_49]|nr:MAG: DNA polymerase (family X) [Candidatus Peregrinibacteria bacterium Greene1014_49]
MVHNAKIAALFRQIAALLQAGAGMEDANVTFKIRAYLRAAKTIEELPEDVSTYGGVKELKALPGIGEATAKKIVEYLEKGTMEALEKLRRSSGGVSAELMGVENLGPKRAILIQKELGITTVPELIAAAKAGKLRSLSRFSEVIEKKILESAGRSKERSTRFARESVEGDVEILLRNVRSVPGVQRAEAAGSYRRRQTTVGDIDILVVTKSPTAVSEAISNLPFVRNIVAQGDKKLSFDLQSGIRVDVRFVSKDQWGSALLYFTGSKEHNIAMRIVAIKKGWKLSEYGLFDAKGKVIASKEERDIYEKLGLEYREPWERTGELIIEN